MDVASDVRFYDLDGTPAGRITPPGLGTISGLVGRFDRPEMFYTFTSPLYPTTVFRFDLGTGTSTPFEPPKLTFDPAQYTTERVFATSKDGTRVPMFITHRKGLKKDGTQPDDALRLRRVRHRDAADASAPDVPAWLERGGVWATANMRGGGEYGEAWHEAGMLEKKQNVFDDFIAAAEYLVKEKYTSPQTLGIMGGSNGGLLVGAVMEQRPDLFAVALPAVGVMDMLRYHKFTGGRRGPTEYGSADERRRHFAYLFKYSPLHNVKRGHLLSGDARHHGRSRRSRRAEPFVQVRGGAAGGAGLRQAGADPRRDAGLARLPADRQADRRARRPVGVRAGEHESLDEGSIDTDPVRALCLVPGAWKVHGFLVPGATFRALQSEHCDVSRASHRARGTGYLPGTRHQAPGTIELLGV